MADYYSSLTGPDIDAALARAKAGGEIDTLLAGKAPAGYGLGESQGRFVTNTSVDTLTKNGWYYLYDGVTGGPSGLSIYHATLFVSSSRSDFTKVQRLILATSGLQGYELRRVYNDTAWLPWEWVNPPMIVGTEYRTTERYLGKPVYVKAVSVGAMPAASGASNRIQVGFNPSNLEKIVRWEGTVTDGTMVCTLPVHASNGMVVGLYGYWYSGIIYIESNGDYSGYSGTLTFWYTKTTD